MIELIKEIVISMQHNKLRTILTGFSVAWGIFMLIILLGSGNGLQNAIMENMGISEGKEETAINIYPGRTQKAYKGYPKNRSLSFQYSDIEYLKNSVDNVKSIQASRYSSSQTSRNNKSVGTQVRGVTSEIDKMDDLKILNGRYLNETDIDKRRKVVVLNEYAAEVLFPKDEDPVDQVVTVGSINFRVVGVFESKSTYSNIHIPLTTSLMIYKPKLNREMSELIVETVGVETLAQSDEVEKQIRKALATKYTFDEKDRGAIYVWSRIENVLESNMIFGGMNAFIWLIGLGTLLAGVVGVSNIMQVTVRERTNEFGIRKSMGATPRSLVRLILIESIVLTVSFGYIGLVGGTFVMEAVAYVLESGMIDTGQEIMSGREAPAVFKDPTIDLGIAFSATLVLIIAGTIAGYIPARRAAKLKTIDAMRHNK